MTLHQKLIEAIKIEKANKDTMDLFDFLCNQGHEVSKNDLVLLAKELWYAAENTFKLHKEPVMRADYIETLLENLPSYWNANDEDE